ncbi:unnamed protein product [Cuscuta epithymum]|uniref:Uncharacterized protein n=1 Tax=Cuscuta epithymum TaxID=186058 RepID=A0AAV0GKX3_9ASTE|nr:unnamed protein product [Cuscuta epithymum]
MASGELSKLIKPWEAARNCTGGSFTLSGANMLSSSQTHGWPTIRIQTNGRCDIGLLNLGGSALVCLLCDLQRLIRSAEEELSSGIIKQPKSERLEIKKKLRYAARKVHFIMCWVHEQPKEGWCSLAAVVKVKMSQTMEYIGTGACFREGKT